MEFIVAEFENGLLRPLTRLELRQGERVRLAIVREPDPRRWDLARLAQGSAEDVALAEEGLAEWADMLDREDRR